MSEKKSESSSAGSGVLILLCLIGAGVYRGWLWFDGEGYLRHVVSASITAQAEWLPGETKDCTSSPLPARVSSDLPRGDVFSEIACDGGPSHTVKIEFYGQQVQPKIFMATWSCTRNNVSSFNDQAFTCKQTGTY